MLDEKVDRLQTILEIDDSALASTLLDDSGWDIEVGIISLIGYPLIRYSWPWRTISTHRRAARRILRIATLQPHPLDFQYLLPSLMSASVLEDQPRQAHSFGLSGEGYSGWL